MGIIEFVKQILINNRFKESHIDELLESNFFYQRKIFLFMKSISLRVFGKPDYLKNSI
jgi:hypothetical protein